MSSPSSVSTQGATTARPSARARGGVGSEGQRHRRAAGGLADHEAPAGEEPPPRPEPLPAIDVGAAGGRVLRGAAPRDHRGCAARDSNSEPADYEHLTSVRCALKRAERRYTVRRRASPRLCPWRLRRPDDVHVVMWASPTPGGQQLGSPLGRLDRCTSASSHLCAKPRRQGGVMSRQSPRRSSFCSLRRPSRPLSFRPDLGRILQHRSLFVLP